MKGKSLAFWWQGLINLTSPFSWHLLSQASLIKESSREFHTCPVLTGPWESRGFQDGQEKKKEKYRTFPLSVITWTLYISCHVVSIFTKCSQCSISERFCAWGREGGEWVGVKGWRTNAATLGEEVKSFKRYSVTRSNVDLKWKPFFGMWVREGSRTAKKSLH